MNAAQLILADAIAELMKNGETVEDVLDHLQDYYQMVARDSCLTKEARIRAEACRQIADEAYRMVRQLTK